MTHYQNKYRVESNRWRLWDYSLPARYFITICIADKQPILGWIKEGRMVLSVNGIIVTDEIKKIPSYHPRCILDEWIVMPNHIHLLIILGEYDYHNGVYEKFGANQITVEKIHEFSLQGQEHNFNWCLDSNYNPTKEEIIDYRKYRRQMIIPKLIGKLKMKTSKQMNLNRNSPKLKNWQFNYYDHVIRNERSYLRIKKYIQRNAAKWEEDRFYQK